MEHKFYTDNFERLLKEQADEFRMYPSKRVWHSIYNDLHPDRKWPSIAVSLVLVTTLFLIGYWNNNAGPVAGGTAKTGTPVAALAAAGSYHNLNTPSVTGSASEEINNSTLKNSNSRNVSITKEEPGESKNATASLYSGNGPYDAAIINSAAVPEHQVPARNAKKPAPVTAASPDNIENTQPAAGNAGSLAYTKITAAAIAAGKINSAVSANLESNQAYNASTGSNSAISQPVEAGTVTEDELSVFNSAIAPLSNTADVVEKTAKTGTLNNGGIKVPAAVKNTLAAKQLSAEDRSWIEHYSFYNKTSRKRWRGRLSSEIFLTPGAGLRKMVSNTNFAMAAAPSVVNISPALPATAIAYKPGITFEIGAGLSYSLAKSIRIKAGIQANFTNYSVGVTDINHPVLTSLMLNNVSAGYPYLESRASSLANIPGLNNKRAHNQTSQIAVPVGVAVKLSGNSKLDWYVASTIQPTYVFGGKAYLASADQNNFIADASLIRKWNVNAAAETYIQYKMEGFTLQAGPEFRQQLISTYSKKYTYNEKLYNIGVKIGLVKNF